MKKEVNALCIVAHPDDELIWMGGTILNHPNWNWTIISLCRKDDPDRMPKFVQACKRYKANCIISDLDDEKLNRLSPNLVSEKIKSLLPSRSYDYIFTHGKNGEYGHLRHKEVHKAVKKLISQRDLICNKIYFFSYIPGDQVAPHNPQLRIPIPNKSADLYVQLNSSKYSEKIKLITKLYGFKENIFETLSCNKGEAFVS